MLELGEQFFVAQGVAEQIMKTTERRISEIRTKAEQDAAQAKASQTRVVASMKGERVTVSEIAQRLELSTAEVRALLKDFPDRTDSDAVGATADGKDHEVGEAAEVPERKSVSV